MNILDGICLFIIGFSVMLSLVCGTKKIKLKIYSFLTIIFTSVFLGNKMSGILFSDIVKTYGLKVESAFVKAAVNILASALGTLLIFLCLFRILKRIFAIVDGKIERSLNCIIIDTLLGAMTGLCDASLFIFSLMVIIIAVSFFFEKKIVLKNDVLLSEYKIIYKLSRILS